MNNIVMRTVTVGAAYAPLVAESLVATVTLSCPPSNAGPVYKGDDGSDVPWQAAEWHTLVRVNLVDILVKGTPGDVVTLVGGTW
jgi:hypothetical protein